MQPAVRFTFSLLLVLWGAILLVGCTITQQAYLQDIKVSGPMYQPPVTLAGHDSAGAFRISPRFTLNPRRTLTGTAEGHSPVGQNGQFNVDTVKGSGGWYLAEHPGNTMTFSGKNLEWDLPNYDVGLDAQYYMNNTVVWSFGVNFASSGDQSQFGGTLGLGFVGRGRGAAFRLDGGIHIQSITYDAETLVRTTTTSIFGPSTEEIGIFRDRTSDTHVDYFGSFTVNSTVENWPFDLVLNVALAKETLASFNPHTTVLEGPFIYYSFTDFRADVSVTVLSINPAISINLGESQRLQAGVRFTTWTDLQGGDPSNLIQPFVQFDLGM